MTGQNPYAPPRAAVADITASHEPIPPCADVETACILYWVSFGISLIAKAVDLTRLSGSRELTTVAIGSLVGVAFGFLITWWITRKLRAGRNWMRWLITIVNVASFLIILLLWNRLSPVYRAMAQDTTTVVFTGSQMLIGFAVLVLLFTKASRDWFDEWARV